MADSPNHEEQPPPINTITTATTTTITTSTITTASTSAYAVSSPRGTQPEPIEDPEAIAALAGGERIRYQLGAIKNSRDLLRLCDHARLSTVGDNSELRDRLWRSEMRRLYPRVAIEWNPAVDERMEEAPYTLSGALMEPEVDDTIRERIHQYSYEEPIAPSTSTTRTDRILDSLPTGQSFGRFQDPISLNDTEDYPAHQYTPRPPTRPRPPPTVTFELPEPSPSLLHPAQHPLQRPNSIISNPPPPVTHAPPPMPQISPAYNETFQISRPTQPRHQSTAHRLPTSPRPALYHPHTPSRTIGSTSIRDIAGIDQFRRFGPKFAGKRGEDGEEFLLRLYEYCESREYTAEELLKLLSEAFQGEALMWYRVERASMTSYDEFLYLFRGRFGHLDFQERIRRELETRTQGPGEPVGEYLTKMRTYFSHINPPMSLESQLNICYDNLHPDIAVYLRRDEIYSFADLIAKGRHIETMRDRARNYRPPPPANQSVLPCAAYTYPTKPSRGHVAAMSATKTPTANPTSPVNTPDNEMQPHSAPLTAIQPPSTPAGNLAPSPQPVQPTPSQSQSPMPSNQPQSPNRRARSNTVRCYNCREPGHVYRECPQPLGSFCRLCGLPGVDVNSCSRCRRIREGNSSGGGQ